MLTEKKREKERDNEHRDVAFDDYEVVGRSK